jgi:hypothetical protein
LMMYLGTANSAGTISPYIKSYFRLPTESNITSNLLPACFLADMIVMPIGSALTQKGWSPKISIAVGACISIPAFFLASFMKEFWAFAVFYIFAFGWAHGLMYMAPVHNAYLFFPDNAGLASGIILGGFGVGPSVFN